MTALDVRLATAPKASGTIAGTASQAFVDLALHRQRLYVARTDVSTTDIAVYDVTTPTSPVALILITITPAPTEIHALAATGRVLAFVSSAGSYGPPYTLNVVRLGTNRDGASADVLPVYTSQLPLGNPTFVGDTFYVRHNLGIASFDLTPLWMNGQAPVYLGSQGSSTAPGARAGANRRRNRRRPGSRSTGSSGRG